MARQTDLLSVDEARDRIVARFVRLEAERVPLGDASGRILARDIEAGMDVPPFANSSMDGFALRAAETADSTSAQPVVFQVLSHIAAGSVAAGAIGPGSSARIMTGAPLPSGANAVIPFEDVEDRGQSIVVTSPVKTGACVRPAGNDFHAGQIVLRAGVQIDARHIALSATLGHREILVIRKPLVTVLATGDELAEPGQPLAPGQIFNSNTPMLAAAIEEAGGTANRVRAATDDPAAIRRVLDESVDSDLIVTSGGASVGDHDYIKDVIEEIGEVGFWRVRMRPGKPLLFGSVQGVPVLGLPGNPTSAFVTFEQFVRPALRAMLGAEQRRPVMEVVVDDRIANHGGRRTYARVHLRREGQRFHACLAGSQDSAMVLPLAQAEGLLIIPEDCEVMSPGTVATVQILSLPVS